MENESLDTMTEHLLSTLPMLQKSCTILAERECDLHGIDPTEVHCLVDVQLSSSIAIRIEPASVPIVRISATWAYSQLIGQTSDNLAYGIRKAVRIAHSQFRWHLGRSKPATAAEYVENARRFRTANPDGFSLPPKTFRCRLVVEMSDPMTGETVSRNHVRPEELEDVRKELAHELTGMVYAHEQVADLLDMLHAHKQYMTESEPTAMDILPVSRGYTITSLHYNTVSVDD